MIVPREVTPDEGEKVLHLRWADGHESAIAYAALRERCPCARCRSTRDAGRIPLMMALSTKLLSWKRMGNYALNFSWGDSHSEGIFSYTVLRDMCGCAECTGDA